MSLSKTLYLSAPYQTAYSITTDNSDLEKLLRMRYGRYLTDESEDGRQYRSVVISKYRRAFNMQCGEKLYRTRVPLRAFDSYMLKTVEFDDKVIAFHASAVECGGKAYVFLARSGAGKTTLCAYLTAHGFGYITEDCVLIDRETLRVYPTPHRSACVPAVSPRLKRRASVCPLSKECSRANCSAISTSRTTRSKNHSSSAGYTSSCVPSI